MLTNIDEIMRLASVYATRRVRQYAVMQPNYRGPESEDKMGQKVAEAREALRKAVEAALTAT